MGLLPDFIADFGKVEDDKQNTINLFIFYFLIALIFAILYIHLMLKNLVEVTDKILDIFHDDMNFSPLIPFGCLISRQEA